MQTQQLRLAIQVLVPRLARYLRHTAKRILHLLVQVLHHLLVAKRQMPRQRATLCRREVLHGMKTKGREVSDRTYPLSLARSTEGMGRITTDRYAPQHPLQVRLRNKEVPLALHDRKQSVVVTRDTRQIHRDNRFRPRGDSPLHGLIVHLQTALLHIHEDQGSSHMRHHRRTRRIGISRDDHLVTLANPQQPQGHFPTRRL